MTANLLPLRDYQREAIDAVRADWETGRRRTAAVLPTGAGKTVVFAHLSAEWLSEHHGRRVLVLAHRTELIDQAAGKLHSVAPHLRIGVVKAEQNRTLADVIVGSVPTLGGTNDRRRRQLTDVGMVIVDEAHHATAASYRRILDHFDTVPTVGFTATMSRGDKSALGDVWQNVCYARSISEMIGAGYLVRPHGRRVMVEDLDLSGVKTIGGDYSEAAVGEALEHSLAPEAIAKALVEHAGTRPTIIFAPTVASATLILSAVTDAGFTGALVHGAMPDDERKRALADFVAGRIQVLANCMVLTEGTDLPLASCAVIARPTTHRGLYIQMVGRVLRPYPGKGDALVLDVVGASQRHALISPVELFGEDGEMSEREPCLCFGGDNVCPCGLVCLKSCPCGGGRECGCVKPDVEELVGLREEKPLVNGPLTSVEVDLFHGSESAWLRTHLGIWFVNAGERLIAIVPAPRVGAWDVVAMHAKRHGDSRYVIRDIDDLSYAMKWAEGDITSTEQVVARKERDWRRRRPSDAQRNLCQAMGIPLVDGMTKGEVSNVLSVVFASRRIDVHVPAYARAQLQGVGQ